MRLTVKVFNARII